MIRDRVCWRIPHDEHIPETMDVFDLPIYVEN